MTAREWKPGDVAMVTFDNASIAMRSRGETDITTSIGLRREDDWALPSYGTSIESDDARPLVVLDPEDREQVERLLTAYQSQYPLGRGDQWGTHADNMQAALRSLTRPPKPAEPTGLGAQVRDRDGEMWVRNVQGAWINLHGRYGLDPAQTWDGLCEKYGPIEVSA